MKNIIRKKLFGNRKKLSGYQQWHLEDVVEKETDFKLWSEKSIKSREKELAYYEEEELTRKVF